MIDNLPIAVPALIVLAVLILLAIGLAWRDRDEGEELRETGRRTKDKASTLTGGILGGVTVILFGLFGALQQMGGAGFDAGIFALDVLGSNPEVSGGVIAAILGFLGLNNTIQISPFTYLGISMVIIGVGMLYAAKRRLDKKAAVG